jgi:hypothetical protein
LKRNSVVVWKPIAVPQNLTVVGEVDGKREKSGEAVVLTRLVESRSNKRCSCRIRVFPLLQREAEQEVTTNKVQRCGVYVVVLLVTMTLLETSVG